MNYKPSNFPLSLTLSPYYYFFALPPQSSPFPQLLVHHAPGEYLPLSADKSYRVLLFRSMHPAEKLFEMRQKFIVMFYRLTETKTGIKNNVLHTQIT